MSGLWVVTCLDSGWSAHYKTKEQAERAMQALGVAAIKDSRVCAFQHTIEQLDEPDE